MTSPIQLSAKKYAFLTSTLLLTCTGFACRVLGFFYRIFLSRTIGAEGLGIYNMIHPVFGICFAMCAGSIQTALSQYIASHAEKGRTVFRIGLSISITMSFILAYLICRHADFLAVYILMEPRCAPYLPLMGLSVPFAALHACINGYYYGMQKAKVPAFSQVVEQVIRMTLVFFIASAWLEKGGVITVHLAVIGHLIGEIASAAYTFLCMCFFPPQKRNHTETDSSSKIRNCAVPLMLLALPLMSNRLVLNVLASAEAIWIPNRLQAYGLSSSDAFSIYGVLTGMALPFILFPSTIFNSMAVLLLPTVAQAQSDGNNSRISSTVSMSIRYSLYIGILCIGIFTLFGIPLGTSVFNDKNSGTFITILAWLCPFLYLATTMGSILNGLGKTAVTFFQNTVSLLIRLAFVIFGIPHFGILAYLCGILVGELSLALMHLLYLRRLIPFKWDAYDMILKPVFLVTISIGIFHALSMLPDPFSGLPLFIKTSIQIGIICLCYAFLLFVTSKNRGCR